MTKPLLSPMKSPLMYGFFGDIEREKRRKENILYSLVTRAQFTLNGEVVLQNSN